MDHRPQREHRHVLWISHFEPRANAVLSGPHYVEPVGLASPVREPHQAEPSFVEVIHRKEKDRFDKPFSDDFRPRSAPPILHKYRCLLDRYGVAGASVLEKLLGLYDVFPDVEAGLRLTGARRIGGMFLGSGAAGRLRELVLGPYEACDRQAKTEESDNDTDGLQPVHVITRCKLRSSKCPAHHDYRPVARLLPPRSRALCRPARREPIAMERGLGLQRRGSNNLMGHPSPLIHRGVVGVLRFIQPENSVGRPFGRQRGRGTPLLT